MVIVLCMGGGAPVRVVFCRVARDNRADLERLRELDRTTTTYEAMRKDARNANETDIRSLWKRGDELYQSGDANGARSAFEGALDLGGDTLELRVNIAACALIRKDYEGALFHSTRVINILTRRQVKNSLSQKDMRLLLLALSRRAAVHTRLADEEHLVKAVGDMERCLELAPNDEGLVKDLVTIKQVLCDVTNGVNCTYPDEDSADDSDDGAARIATGDDGRVTVHVVDPAAATEAGHHVPDDGVVTADPPQDTSLELD